MRLTGRRASRSNPNSVENDLGFGTKISTDGGRLINPDGSFNVIRRGIFTWTPYQSLVEMSWLRFFLLLGLFYLLVNAVFGLLFWWCGISGFSGIKPGGTLEVFSQLFFLSVQTFTTVGYGAISPTSFGANVVATLDAFVGLMFFAVATGLLFARFSKPKAQLLFSKNALIAPYRGGTSFQFRIANLRNNKVINLEAKLSMTWIQECDDDNVRRFAALPLERSRVALFPLNWTIVHPIDSRSPLYNKTREELEAMQAEFIVLIQGFDETFAQNIHTNGSYVAGEVIDNASFDRMYFPEDGHTVLDLDLVGSYTLVEPPTTTQE